MNRKLRIFLSKGLPRFLVLWAQVLLREWVHLKAVTTKLCKKACLLLNHNEISSGSASGPNVSFMIC